ncbi:class I SAM-dependent methyltransferase [Paenibacillus sp. Marseille-Q4541]|uniref:class I SAM-dependent methyltransferase n=1 Tax=Paenibacillus sp. Marseille-Q4541 TaxID=2831522 RepID=UPI001BA703EE|nr:class I SAM-dependent methyltransferase [Paenibacillus sp. Marseille-Q4541]
MKQNKYDDPSFFEQYSQMSRSKHGLDAAGEWSILKAMLPNLQDADVLDLGCGYGWHCRYAREHGAKSVIGIDISDRMLDKAKEMTKDSAIRYERVAIEDATFDAGQFDVVLSSLALHYIEDFSSAAQKINEFLAPNGHFVFSVEHPMFTSLPAQDWHYNTEGEKLHWPIDRYHEEGLREANFLGHEVEKYHRTLSTYVNTLIASGFEITNMSELKPTEQMLQDNPAYYEEIRRPMFLLMSAVKKS